MRTRRYLFAMMLLGAGYTTGLGQARPEFEVASVRPVDVAKLGGSFDINLGSVRGDELSLGNVTLKDCIRFAYGVASDDQVVGPEWIGSKQFLYAIDAKAVPGTSREQLRAMMQTLLAQRFALVMHREPKEMSYYALVVAKGGMKMHIVKQVAPDYGGTTYGRHIDSVLEMPTLAYLLSRFERERPIIDETKLSGRYAVNLDWSLERDQSAGEAPGPSLFTALDEQLGLRLERRKGPLEVLAIDSAEKVPIPD